MKHLATLAACSAVFLLAPITHAENWFVELGLGGATVEIDQVNPTNAVEELASDDGGFSSTIGVGYFIADSSFLKVTYVDFGSASPLILIAETFEYSSVRAGIGFEYPAAGRWALSLEAGVAFWDIKVRESGLFNPGPEETASTDGADLYAQLGVAFRFTERFQMGLFRDYESNDLGRIDGARLGFRYRF